MEEEGAGEYVTYEDHLADKAAALKALEDKIKRMKSSHSMMVLRNGVVDDWSEADWIVACEDKDEMNE